MTIRCCMVVTLVWLMKLSEYSAQTTQPSGGSSTGRLSEECSDGLRCSTMGSFCAAADADGKKRCKCLMTEKANDFFEEAGSPPDRCIPTARVPLTSATCLTNADCIRLPNTICEMGPPSSPGYNAYKLCSCSYGYQPDLVFPGCKRYSNTSDPPIGLCPPNYAFLPSVERFTPVLCQRVYFVPQTWSDACRTCRDDMADIGGPMPVGQYEVPWWTNWRRHPSFSLALAANASRVTGLSVVMGRYWYHETVYGRDPDAPMRRAASLVGAKWEPQGNYLNMGFPSLELEEEPLNKCATMRMIDSDNVIILSTAQCNSKHPFVCELSIRNVQESVFSRERTVNLTALWLDYGNDSVQYYVSKSLLDLNVNDQISISHRHLLSRSIFTDQFPAALRKTFEICDAIFPPELVRTISGSALMDRWATTLVESPTGRTCYFTAAKEEGAEVTSLLARRDFCHAMHTTTLKTLTFGQQFYSRYIWPAAGSAHRLGVTPPHWVDGTWRSFSGNPLPISTWMWMDSCAVPIELHSWISTSEDGSGSCPIESMYNITEASQEFSAVSVPWQRVPCDSLAIPVCQKDLPPLNKRPSPEFNPTVNLHRRNTVQAIANQHLLSSSRGNNNVNGTTTLPLAECSVDNGTLVNLKSVSFFGPNISRLAEYDGGRAVLVPSNAMAPASLEIGCFRNLTKVSCEALVYYLQPSLLTTPTSPDTLAMAADVLQTLRKRWSYIVELSGYYHCAMLLRETLEWHHSAAVLLKDKAIRFAFQLLATSNSDYMENEWRQLASLIVSAFAEWLRMNYGELGEQTLLPLSTTVIAVQRRGQTTSTTTLSGHVVIHAVLANVLDTFIPFAADNQSTALPDTESSTLSSSFPSTYNGRNSDSSFPEAAVSGRILTEFLPSERERLDGFAAYLNSPTFSARIQTKRDLSQSPWPIDWQFRHPGSDWIKATDGCPAGVKRYDNGVFHWLPIREYDVPSGDANAPLEFCPDRDFRRQCIGNFDVGYTAVYPIVPCSEPPTSPTLLTNYLADFLNNPTYDVTSIQATADNVFAALINQTRKSNVTVTDVNFIGAFLETIAKNNISQELFQTLVGIIGQVAQLPKEQLETAQSYSGAGNRIIQALDSLASSVQIPADSNASISVNLPSLGIKAFRVPQNSSFTSESIVGFTAIANSTNVSAIVNGDKRTGVAAETAISIVLPGRLVRELYNKSASMEGGLPGYFLVLRDTALLSVQAPIRVIRDPNIIIRSYRDHGPIPGDPGHAGPKPEFEPVGQERVQQRASWVIGASFGMPIFGLVEPVVITAKIDHYESARNYSCIFWNTSAEQGLGAWRTDGCWVKNHTRNHIICNCNHLTSFAILVDFYRDSTAALPALPAFLDALTVAALSLSIVGLILTLLLLLLSSKITQSTFRKRLSRNEFVMVNLSAALLLAYVTFLAGIDQTATRDGCITAGVFIHYFFLATFLWQAVEGFLLYSAFVASSSAYRLTYFRAKSMFVCWGVPAVIVIIVLIINPELYIGKNNCWIGAYPAPFYVTFVTPICLMLISNVFVFTMVIRELLCGAKMEIRSTRNKKDVSTQLRRCLSLFFLLGLPWLLLTLNVFHGSNDGRLALHILIIIFCGTQGLAIFTVEVYGMRKELAETLHRCKKKPTSYDVSLVQLNNSRGSSSDADLSAKKRF